MKRGSNKDNLLEVKFGELFGNINTFTITGTYHKGKLISGDTELELEMPDSMDGGKVFIQGHFGKDGELAADTIYAYDIYGRRFYGEDDDTGKEEGIRPED